MILLVILYVSDYIDFYLCAESARDQSSLLLDMVRHLFGLTVDRHGVGSELAHQCLERIQLMGLMSGIARPLIGHDHAGLRLVPNLLSRLPEPIGVLLLGVRCRRLLPT